MFNNLLIISDDKDIQEEILCIQKLQERERPCPCCGEVRSRPIACTRSSPLYMDFLELFWSFFQVWSNFLLWWGLSCEGQCQAPHLLWDQSQRHVLTRMDVSEKRQWTLWGISLKDMFWSNIIVAWKVTASSVESVSETCFDLSVISTSRRGSDPLSTSPSVFTNLMNLFWLKCNQSDRKINTFQLQSPSS